MPPTSVLLFAPLLALVIPAPRAFAQASLGVPSLHLAPAFELPLAERAHVAAGLSAVAPGLSATPAIAVTRGASLAISASTTDEGGADAATAEPDDYARLTMERAELTSLHRPLGIATLASMAVTVALGFIQYSNLYGFFGSQGDNPCVNGDAILGQGQCLGQPWPHLVSALVTTGLYTATFALSVLMPDPGGLDEGESDYAKNLRMHKLLRWVHLGGMVAQTLLGIVIANGDTFGLDRSNDFGTLQALSTVHLGIGLVTLGAMSWAAALFTF